MDFANHANEGRSLGLHFPYSAITPGTVLAHARRVKTRRRLISALEKLNNDETDLWRIKTLRLGLEVCGESWDYVDNVTLGHAFAELAQPRGVLEVGVRRGYATAAIASANPTVELQLFDLWEDTYYGADPGSIGLVQEQLTRVGHRGKVHFQRGNSHTLLPRFFASQPNRVFDMVLVDGDHTDRGANQDLEDLFPHVAPGGILIFDDLAHPGFPTLLALWQKWVKRLGLSFRFADYFGHGHGVGIAIRAW